MSGNKSKLIAFNYFGGKFTYIDDIYPYFPLEKHFSHMCELFGGSGVLSINYKPNKPLIRTINELNGDITNFFKILRDRHQELIEVLLLTPVSEQEYLNCFEYCEDDLERARRFYVRVRQSFFGLGAQRKNKGWHMAKSKANSNGGESVSKWNNSIPKLMEVAELLASNFQIINSDYTSAIDRVDTASSFFYADPPYPYITRSSSNDYKYEFSDQDHVELSKRLHAIKGYAMISSYESDLYSNLYSDWNFIKLPKKLNGIRTKQQHECIWFNYPLELTVKQQLTLNL